jgi:hypothetical protein
LAVYRFWVKWGFILKSRTRIRISSEFGVHLASYDPPRLCINHPRYKSNGPDSFRDKELNNRLTETQQILRNYAKSYNYIIINFLGRCFSLTNVPKNLVGFCGLYCGTCGIHQGRIKQAVENLRNMIGAYGFDKIIPELAKYEPSFKHYPEFDQVMNGLVRLFGECPGCIAGGGDPNCVVRQCCKQKNYATCAECTEMDACEKLQRVGGSLDNLKRIKAAGVDKWAEEMQKRVNAGYC